MCDVLGQLKAQIPTAEEVEVLSNAPVPAEPIKSELFFRLIIAAGVEKYTRGLASLELWSEGSARLAQVFLKKY